jgi:hypothetical protein
LLSVVRHVVLRRVKSVSLLQANRALRCIATADWAQQIEPGVRKANGGILAYAALLSLANPAAIIGVFRARTLSVCRSLLAPKNKDGITAVRLTR